MLATDCAESGAAPARGGIYDYGVQSLTGRRDSMMISIPLRLGDGS
jgi:hypothetical protein